MTRAVALLLVGLAIWHAAIVSPRPSDGLYVVGLILTIIALANIPA